MIEKEEDKGKIGMIIMILAILMIVALIGPHFYFAYNKHLQDEREIDYLREVIYERNVTKEYRQGWLDCVNELHDFRTKDTNVTSACIR